MPPLANAMRWVSQITTLSLSMVLPALAGNWLDGKWGTAPWLAVVGGVLGAAMGVLQLLQIVQMTEKKMSEKKMSGGDDQSRVD